MALALSAWLDTEDEAWWELCLLRFALAAAGNQRWGRPAVQMSRVSKGGSVTA